MHVCGHWLGAVSCDQKNGHFQAVLWRHICSLLVTCGLWVCGEICWRRSGVSFDTESDQIGHIVNNLFEIQNGSNSVILISFLLSVLVCNLLDMMSQTLWSILYTQSNTTNVHSPHPPISDNFYEMTYSFVYTVIESNQHATLRRISKIVDNSTIKGFNQFSWDHLVNSANNWHFISCLSLHIFPNSYFFHSFCKYRPNRGGNPLGWVGDNTRYRAIF
jgi:hypothetical protein